MAIPFTAKNRQELRQDIGYNQDALFIGSCTSAGTSATIVDTAVTGGTDDHKGKSIIFVSGTTANIGLIVTVTGYNATTHTLTFTPTVTATASSDGYEMYDETTSVARIHAMINRAIRGASEKVLVAKEDHSLILEDGLYEYPIPSGFVAVHSLERVYQTEVSHDIDDCDSASNWTAGSSVTVAADTDFKKEGDGSIKLTVAAGAGVQLLAYNSFASLNISDCDEVVFWLYSTVALAAADLQFHLDDTAGCGSAVETLSLPAISANTWTRVVLSLAAPYADTATIACGIYQAVDKGACVLYVDDIYAQDSKSQVYRLIDPYRWGIAKKDTAGRLRITEAGYSEIGGLQQLRLHGYRLAAELSDDSTDCDVDPDYVIARATALLLQSRSRGNVKDTDANLSRAAMLHQQADKRLKAVETSFAMNTRWL